MAKNFNLSKIMGMAWNLARKGASFFGGNAKMYFASALAIIWKEEKALAHIGKTKSMTVYRKGFGNRFLLPGLPLPAPSLRKGQFMLPGICE